VNIQERRETLNRASREYYVKNREVVKASKKRYRDNMKIKVLRHYSHGTMKCKCGYSDTRALCIDHINGGGVQHRKKIGESNLYIWLVRNNYPKGFQVLCHNCNIVKKIER